MRPFLLLRELATDGVVERLRWVLVHSLWQFMVVVLVTAVVVRLLAHGRATARYVVLVGALAVIVACPVVTWSLLPAPVVLTRSPAEVQTPVLDEPATNTLDKERRRGTLGA